MRMRVSDGIISLNTENINLLPQYHRKIKLDFAPEMQAPKN